MTDAKPLDRCSASLQRIWKPLTEGFEAEFRLEGLSGTPVPKVLEEDFPSPPEVQVSSQATTISDGDLLWEQVARKALDRAESGSVPETADPSDIGRRLAERLRRKLLSQLAGVLIANSDDESISALTKQTWLAQVSAALGGLTGVVWVDQANFEKVKGWSEKAEALRVRNIGPAMSVPFQSGKSPAIRMLLFPSSRRLIARTETLPLTLGYDSTWAQHGRIRLGCWYHYQLHLGEGVMQKVRWWS